LVQVRHQIGGRHAGCAGVHHPLRERAQAASMVGLRSPAAQVRLAGQHSERGAVHGCGLPDMAGRVAHGRLRVEREQRIRQPDALHAFINVSVPDAVVSVSTPPLSMHR
jgi:hypothetical protein